MGDTFIFILIPNYAKSYKKVNQSLMLTGSNNY